MPKYLKIRGRRVSERVPVRVLRKSAKSHSGRRSPLLKVVRSNRLLISRLKVRFLPRSPSFQQVTSHHLPFHLPLKANPATFEAAWAISSVTTSPYTFIVVRMSECRISFCCTAIGVPTASSHDRYV